MDCKTEVIKEIILKYSDSVQSDSLKKLENILITVLYDYSVIKQERALSTQVEIPNEQYVKQFLAIKKVNGLSEKSLKAYYTELRLMFAFLNKPVKDITANDIRYYLASEQASNNLSNGYLDTKLRYMRSFFKTLRIEGYLHTDPTERIQKIKSPKVIKKPFTDEELEKLRQSALADLRLKAIVEFLSSTGCRVSEVSKANRTDIKDDKLIITGKGNKQRFVYLNARALLAIKAYCQSRTDDNIALFVGKKQNSNKKIERLQVGSIEKMIRDLGKKTGIENCHPHRFRRTTATIALKNGMPIEQVSLMLGHDELSTTQIYARSDESELHIAHKKYVR